MIPTIQIQRIAKVEKKSYFLSLWFKSFASPEIFVKKMVIITRFRELIRPTNFVSLNQRKCSNAHHTLQLNGRGKKNLIAERRKTRRDLKQICESVVCFIFKPCYILNRTEGGNFVELQLLFFKSVHSPKK